VIKFVKEGDEHYVEARKALAALYFSGDGSLDGHGDPEAVNYLGWHPLTSYYYDRDLDFIAEGLMELTLQYLGNPSRSYLVYVDWDIVEVTVTIIYKELPSQCGEVNEAQSGKVGQEG
jgi:hypothetical protein